MLEPRVVAERIDASFSDSGAIPGLREAFRARKIGWPTAQETARWERILRWHNEGKSPVEIAELDWSVGMVEDTNAEQDRLKAQMFRGARPARAPVPPPNPLPSPAPPCAVRKESRVSLPTRADVEKGQKPPFSPTEERDRAPAPLLEAHPPPSVEAIRREIRVATSQRGWTEREVLRALAAGGAVLSDQEDPLSVRWIPHLSREAIRKALQTDLRETLEDLQRACLGAREQGWTREGVAFALKGAGATWENKRIVSCPEGAIRPLIRLLSAPPPVQK